MRILGYNFGQKIVDKFTKLSKTGFSMECFNADILQYSGTTVQIFLLGGGLGTCHQAFLGLFLKVPKFLIS